jgi:hypothetical protein
MAVSLLYANVDSERPTDQHEIMSGSKAASQTEQQSSEQQSSTSLLGWNDCGPNDYGVGAAAAAGGAAGAVLFDQVLLVGATAGLSVFLHFLLCRVASAW